MLVVNSAVVNLLTANDDNIITLEYDDRVKLTFTPSSADLLSDVESLGEYIRDTATVNVVDNDSEYILLSLLFSFLLEVLILCYKINTSIVQGSGNGTTKHHHL